MWLCVSTRPGMTVWPARSTTVAPEGTVVDAAAPTATILPPWTTRVPRSMGGPSTGMIRALMKAAVCVWPADGTTAAEQRDQHGGLHRAVAASRVYGRHESPSEKECQYASGRGRGDPTHSLQSDQGSRPVQLPTRTCRPTAIPGAGFTSSGRRTSCTNARASNGSSLTGGGGWWPLALAMGTFAALLVAAGIAVTEGALHPAPPAASAGGRGRRRTCRDGGRRHADRRAVHRARRRGPGGLEFLEARRRPRHGGRAARDWRSDAPSQLPLAALLLSDGYRVLVPDARAHGASGGAMLTAGIAEAADLGGWVEWARQQHPDECIFAIGTSFGGATLLQSLAETWYCAVDRRSPVCVGILDGVLLARWTRTAHRAMGADGSRRRGGFRIRVLALRTAAAEHGRGRLVQALARSAARDRRRAGRCGAET